MISNNEYKIYFSDSICQTCAEKCKEANAKIRTAVKASRITAQGNERISEALEQGIITDTEAKSLHEMVSLRRSVIMVDDFPPDFS